MLNVEHFKTISLQSFLTAPFGIFTYAHEPAHTGVGVGVDKGAGVSVSMSVSVSVCECECECEWVYVRLNG